MRPIVLLAFLIACTNGTDGTDEPAEQPGEGGGEARARNDVVTIPAEDDGTRLRAVIDRGLQTSGKGPDLVRFVVIRAADRHDARTPNAAFHFVIGDGVELEAGAIEARHIWSNSGQIDGRNEELERYGISIAVERGATQPFSPIVVERTRRIVDALLARVPIHPDCVVAMGEVPFAKDHAADGAERALAEAVRRDLPVPKPDGTIGIVVGETTHDVAYERRDTTIGREVGMMMRKRFDGTDRGMLFIYPHRAQRRFWMRNCFIPMDLAYIKNGRIVQIEKMAAQPGVPTGSLPRYESITPVRMVLEMPEGWFAQHGIREGATVTDLP
ncbi:MAG: DUF192 domain-containing protein [Planctomycetota bacterium]